MHEPECAKLLLLVLSRVFCLIYSTQQKIVGLIGKQIHKPAKETRYGALVEIPIAHEEEL